MLGLLRILRGERFFNRSPHGEPQLIANRATIQPGDLTKAAANSDDTHAPTSSVPSLAIVDD
jgi:hypothetical protein